VTGVGLVVFSSPVHVLDRGGPSDSACRRRYGVWKKSTSTQVKKVHKPASSSRDTRDTSTSMSHSSPTSYSPRHSPAWVAMGKALGRPNLVDPQAT
jgi:hypothetical protein